ncbi:ATP-binding protein [Maritimibacter sp. DP1N21-5]|uniref:sensor histidine kinase n=1 Tax=Maritimibacter sp. DP1N21-5 TaxID=2836867 RepID=UPI001C47D241|nr:ATP-binding protein [Maritimibacter sp. DP1N21-5]MBV7407851.1 sensor histidine kinase [Maritimibacter sp. DP1N21-5]
MARIFTFLIVALMMAGSVGWTVYHDRLDRMAERGEADLSLATDRVAAQLYRYRELAVILSRHPDLQALLAGGGDATVADEVVQSMADMTGAADVAVVDPDGRIVAGSQGASVARDPALAPLARALSGALGTQSETAAAADGPNRYFSFAAPVLRPDGSVSGAVMTRMEVSQIEDNWPGDAPPVFFTDRTGQVFITNRSDLILADRVLEFPAYFDRIVGGHDIWQLDGGRYLPSHAIHLVRDMPTLNLTAEMLIDTSGAFAGAVLWGLITAGALMTFGAVLFFVQQNRMVLAHRLAVEAEANARLEARVSERTQELTAANTALTREVAERKEAQAALQRAQADLVQAGKLSALGQMSAGISHELNQPLMAIRSFAENGEAYFERGKPDIARENLAKISELARRMGRIIQNLRAFARQESGPITDVDLVGVIEAALEVTADKQRRHDVTLDWRSPQAPVIVKGGEVRLQQVVVNLLSNAIDAMGQGGCVSISLTPGDPVQLSVRDSGPGIADPDRVFDPFYSTKSPGSAEGMGLGLSISYGLVQGFGGAIRGANHPEGGAIFTVDLLPSDPKEAAA